MNTLIVHRLKLFGAPSLERDGTLLAGRAAQRHRIALLALLALAPGRRLGRDKLIATLWPESDEERGRNLLKVATYVLRSALGDDALLSAGDELRLHANAVDVDVAVFEEALERQEPARAVALYEGPFMDGFFLAGTPEFEQWMSAERLRLAARHADALETLASSAATAGDVGAAVAWWKTRAGLDPYDSRVAVRLMESLEAAGNRAGALQHAELHRRLLQIEFGIAPPPEIAALAERLRTAPAVELSASALLTSPTTPHGAETVGADGAVSELLAAPKVDAPPVAVPPVVAEPEGAGAVVGTTARAAPPSAASAARKMSIRARLIASGAAALLLFILVAASNGFGDRQGGRSDRASIVVLPFVPMTAERDAEHFSDGLTEEIITRLAALQDVKVISRTSAMHYKGSTKPLPRIAEELKVNHILEGSVRAEGGRLRITAQLIDARNDAHLWAESYDHDAGHSFAVQEEIARAVAGVLELRLGERARRLISRRGTQDTLAYQLYRRARFLWNQRTRESHEHALAYFEQAIARDPLYSDAYAGVADVYLTAFQLGLLELDEDAAYLRMRAAAERALTLDNESADAHTSFAVAQMWRADWRDAERSFRRAIALNPGHATAHSWYSLLLRGLNRTSEALRESRLAAELDPFAVVLVQNLATQCHVARDAGCAREQYGRALEIAAHPSALRGLALFHAEASEHAEALRAIDRAIEVAPHRADFEADLAYVHALAGRVTDARGALIRAKARRAEPFSIARAHVALAETDSAFAWLDRASWRWPHRAARSDPALDPIRDDPRFARLSSAVERQLTMR